MLKSNIGTDQNLSREETLIYDSRWRIEMFFIGSLIAGDEQKREESESKSVAFL